MSTGLSSIMRTSIGLLSLVVISIAPYVLVMHNTIGVRAFNVEFIVIKLAITEKKRYI